MWPQRFLLNKEIKSLPEKLQRCAYGGSLLENFTFLLKLSKAIIIHDSFNSGASKEVVEDFVPHRNLDVLWYAMQNVFHKFCFSLRFHEIKYLEIRNHNHASTIRQVTSELWSSKYLFSLSQTLTNWMVGPVRLRRTRTSTSVFDISLAQQERSCYDWRCLDQRYYKDSTCPAAGAKTVHNARRNLGIQRAYSGGRDDGRVLHTE